MGKVFSEFSIQILIDHKIIINFINRWELFAYVKTSKKIRPNEVQSYFILLFLQVIFKINWY